jgi:hypothetical protein
MIVYHMGSPFLDFFFAFNFYRLNLDWQKNSKTKVEKAFFIFMPSYAEFGFCAPKEKKSLNRVQNIWVDMGIKKSWFYADYKMGQSIFVASSYKKFRTKIPIF